MKRTNLSIFITLILFSIISKAQNPPAAPVLSLSGYADAYVAYYTDSLGVNDYQKFPTISPRSKQFGLNIAQASLRYTSEKVRGNVVLHYGDVTRSAWSPTYNLIQEANAGIRLCKKVWLDGGFFRTHIGTEGLLPKENITSSLAVATYYEPYYEAGFKLNYNPSAKWAFNLYLLNGYNLFEDNNTKKSVGLLITDAVNDEVTLGYNNYLGDDSPEGDTTNRLHFYNNLYLNYQHKKIKIVTGIDFCIQQHADLSNADKSATMFSGLFALQYHACNNWNVYGRAEIYHDPQGFLSGTFFNADNELTGLKLWGITLGAEYKPTDNSYIRFEGRDLMTENSQEIFYWNGSATNNRFEAMINLGVWFP